MTMGFSRGLGYIGIMALSLCGCTHAPQATSSAAAQERIDADPIEPVNRAIYQFNYTFDGLLLKPVTSMYRGVVPEQGRTAVSNVIDNLYTPVVFANSVLQGDPQNSFASFWRFALNTTFGIGGIFDFASAAGLKNRPADLGETFAMYGMGTGPYVVLPIIGPSNARDAFGRLGDAFMNPFNYGNNREIFALWTSTAIDARSRNMQVIDDIYSSSLDPYATFRSGYTQKRAADIQRAKVSRQKSLEQTGGK